MRLTTLRRWRRRYLGIGNGSVLRAIPATIHRHRGTVVEVDGVFLKMDPCLSNFMANMLRRGEHAVGERAVVPPALEPDDVLMELGGGVGHTTTRFAKIIGSDRVFTFEPNPELEPLMRENFRLNGVHPTAEFCLLGHSEGPTEFYVKRDYWASTLSPGSGGRKIEVPMYRINERIREIDPSFLVVDIEGAERDLFDELDFHNIRKLMLEIHPHLIGEEESARVQRLVEAAGFSVADRMECNLLYRRSSRAAAARPSESGALPAGDGLSVARGAWRFDGAVPDVFDDHVSRSIPRYADGHELVVERAAPHLAKGGRCYELGCSTGALTAKLAAGARSDAAAFIGLDHVGGMLERARIRCAGDPRVSFEQADLVESAFASARVIVSYYTLHFIPLAERAPLVRRIFDALEPGGLFLLFEKVRHPDPDRDRELIELYHAFKRSQGFTNEEIRGKDAALEGVLVRRTERENLTMLSDAGFPKVSKVFEELCWQGYAAEK